MEYAFPDSARWRYWRAIFATYGIAWAWVSLLGAIALTARMQFSPALGITEKLIRLFPATSALLAEGGPASFLMTVAFAPLFEEAVFRVLPLSFALAMGSVLEQRYHAHGMRFVRATLLVVCCMLFGMAHGSPANILLQGVIGLLLGALYLRNAATQTRAYLACVTVHALYNFTVTVL